MLRATKPGARPPFRWLAAVVAVVCIAFAGLTFFLMEQNDASVAIAIFLFVGFVMGSIAATGWWPPRR